MPTASNQAQLKLSHSTCLWVSTKTQVMAADSFATANSEQMIVLFFSFDWSYSHNPSIFILGGHSAASNITHHLLLEFTSPMAPKPLTSDPRPPMSMPSLLSSGYRRSEAPRVPSSALFSTYIHNSPWVKASTLPGVNYCCSTPKPLWLAQTHCCQLFPHRCSTNNT